MNKIIPWLVVSVAVIALALALVVGVSALSKTQNLSVASTSTSHVEVTDSRHLTQVSQVNELSSVKLFEDPKQRVKFSYPTFGNNDTATITMRAGWHSGTVYEIHILPKDGQVRTLYTITVTPNTKYSSVEEAFSASYNPEYISYDVWVASSLNNGMRVLTGDGDGHLPATTTDNGDYPRDDFFAMSSSTKSIVTIFRTGDDADLGSETSAALHKMLDGMQTP